MGVAGGKIMSTSPPVISRPPRRRPGRVWYVVAAVIGVGGVAAGIYLAVGQSSRAIQDMVDLAAPGEATVVFDEPGSYTVFHEYRTADGPALASSIVAFSSELDIEVVHADTDGQADVSWPFGNVSYTFGEVSGTNVAVIRITRPGPHRVTAHMDTAPGAAPVLLRIDASGAMGIGFFGALMGGIVLALASAMFAALLAVGVAVSRYLTGRRGRDRPPPAPPGPRPAFPSPHRAAPPPGPPPLPPPSRPPLSPPPSMPPPTGPIRP